MDNNVKLLKIIKLFIGQKYNDKQLKKMIKDKKINIENENYKKWNKIVQNAFPINFINKNKVPILFIYGGNNETIGFDHYYKLKELFEKNNIENELVYFRYDGHML